MISPQAVDEVRRLRNAARSIASRFVQLSKTQQGNSGGEGEADGDR